MSLEESHKIATMERNYLSNSNLLCPEVIKLEYILKLKLKRNDWLLEDTCLQEGDMKS